MNKKHMVWMVPLFVIGGSYFTFTSFQRMDSPEAPLTAAALEEAANEAMLPRSAGQDAAAFHIGIVTTGTSQSCDEFLGAREIVRLYGDAENGGMVRHVVYPENFMVEMEAAIARITSLADDPLMKVIVLNQGVPGTMEAIRKVKARRPDILCLVSQAHEDVDVIASAADLVVYADFMSQGYLVPHSAKRLGADTLVYISFPRHMMDEPMHRGRAITERACRELGMDFAFENAPDPMGDAGIAGAWGFIDEIFPAWIGKYGGNAAFFSTNSALAEPLLRQITKHGGYYIEAGIPSPLLGYPEAFGIDIPEGSLNWPAILKKIEGAVVKAGGGGRMGTWAYSLAFCHSAGLAEFGRLVASGQAEVDDKDALIACYGKFSPGSAWKDRYYINAKTGRETKNCVLVLQDTYVFGKGYLGAAAVRIPPDYFEFSAGMDRKAEKSKFHLGIVTGDESQSPDNFLGAREMVRLYGNADDGGMIRHLTYPSDIMDKLAITKRIMDLADDPLMKVIVVNQAVPGTAEGFRRVKEIRPDIICLAGEAHENTNEITAVADLVVNV
ncbi:MAG: DUF3798 domain-containing protein, partial [Planctomycetota bacterium]|nr:DUF3798 domain-containing protein [Planctomycetota bacterium]